MGSALADPSLAGNGSDTQPVEADDSVLARAAALRFPDIREMGGHARISELVDYITATAIARGELEELRLTAHVNLLDVRKKLARMPAAGRNRASIDEAKRAAAPELAEQEAHWQWVVSRCTEQINRLGGTDYDAASRAYTLVSGT